MILTFILDIAFPNVDPYPYLQSILCDCLIINNITYNFHHCGEQELTDRTRKK